MKDSNDVYSRVTDRIIADLERGILTWRKPWQASNRTVRITRPLRANGLAYQGINIVMLWATAEERGYSNAVWMTFKQALELGGNVRKGEKGSLVVYADQLKRTEQNDKGEDIERAIPFMKAYTVFNVEQIDNLPAAYTPAPLPPAPLNPDMREDGLEQFFKATGADIRHGGERAFFSPGSDFVQMPAFESFRDSESYYATLAHELTHWTGHKARLDRSAFVARFGSADYAREELVAELGSAFLCADLGITPETREDHAAYIQHWLKALKDDKRCIFSAAAHATRAADYLVRQRQPLQMAA